MEGGTYRERERERLETVRAAWRPPTWNNVTYAGPRACLMEIVMTMGRAETYSFRDKTDGLVICFWPLYCACYNAERSRLRLRGIETETDAFQIQGSARRSGRLRNREVEGI